MRVEIDNWQDRGCLVSSGSGAHEGLIIHGYGGCKEEILGLAVGLAARLPLKLLVFDLPGHGDAANEPLTLAAARDAVATATAVLDNPAFFVGHSLGARIGLLGGPETAVCISMPGAARFEGSRTDLLRTLRARRVNEASPLSGLAEVLANGAAPAARTLLICAGRELESVSELAAAWREQGIPCREIRDSSHNDIVSAHETLEVAAAWLKDNLN